MINLLKSISNFLWDNLVVYLLLLVGIYYTIRLGFPQFTKISKSFKYAFKDAFIKNKNDNKVSSFSALSIALAGQIGTGNISGIASAIMIGGAGSIFWMWIAGLLGMGTIFSEAVLSQIYKEKVGENTYSGPAYYMSKGIKNKKLGKFLSSMFAILIIFALGIIGNMVQSNSISVSLNSGFGVDNLLTGVVLSVLVALIIVGGIKRIYKLAELIVPAMILIYLGVGIVILAKFSGEIIPAIKEIFSSAFTAKAALGGAIGVSIKEAVRIGLQRGLFSNEAGMGATPQAHAIADVEHPIEEGLVSMVSVIIDTFIISTISALIILVTKSHLDASGLNPVMISQKSFELAFGETGKGLLGVILLLFSYTTMIGWYYYGEANMAYLFGERSVTFYKIIVVIAILVGTLTHFEILWTISDLLNALMVVPNLIGILLLSNIVVKKYSEWKKSNK